MPLNTEAQAVQSAAQSIGLKAELESTSAANYINFFIDPEARKNVDGFFTINYGDYSDPAALLSTLVLKDGSQNFGGYDNAEITKEMVAARGEADDTKRAEHVVAAQKLITEDVVWIPMAIPNTVLVMNKAITGAPTSFSYMFAPGCRRSARRGNAEAIGLLRFLLRRFATLVVTLLVSSFADLRLAVPGTRQPDRHPHRRPHPIARGDRDPRAPLPPRRAVPRPLLAAG